MKFLIFTNLQVRYTVVIDILNRNCSKLFNITLSLMSYQRRVLKINTFRLAYLTLLLKCVGSLAAHEDFELMKYSEFLSMSKNVTEKAETGSEPFPGTFMKPMKKDVDLLTEVLELLVEYYCNEYEYAFVSVLNIITYLKCYILHY